MKTEEIRELSTKDILERIEDEQAHLVRLRLNHTVTPLDNPHQITAVKRLIARLKTELRQRTLNEEKQ